MNRSFMYLLMFTMLCFTAASWAENDNTSQMKAVEQMFADYRNAWLAGDESGVLDKLSNDVQVFVPGTSGGKLDGKSAVRDFWFPESDVSYPIRSYEISDREIYIEGNLAIVSGRSKLEWDTVEAGEITDSATSNSEFISVLRREGEQWRIFRQMYQMR